MPNAFDNIFLTPSQYTLLKKISNNKTDELSNCNNDILFLLNYSFIDAQIDDSYENGISIDYSSCKITQQGKNYISYSKRKIFSEYYTMILSTIALIVSIIALFK